MKSRFIKCYFISITSENLQAKLRINTFYRNSGVLMIALLVNSIWNFSLQIYDAADNPGRFWTGGHSLMQDFQFKTTMSEFWFSFWIQFTTDICNWSSIQSNFYKKILWRLIVHQGFQKFVLWISPSCNEWYFLRQHLPSNPNIPQHTVFYSILHNWRRKEILYDGYVKRRFKDSFQHSVFLFSGDCCTQMVNLDME